MCRDFSIDKKANIGTIAQAAEASGISAHRFSTVPVAEEVGL
jgi:hypothetical protein